MFKRHRWLINEDEQLKKLYNPQKNNNKIDWEIISIQMKEKNIIKTAKQCKERWKNQINPFLYNKKKKWTQEENKELFDLHRKKGNRWTIISKFFEGRSVNCVKNNFFKLMKKSLKNSIKFSGVDKSTFFINNLKPKILGNFLKSKFTVKIPVLEKKGFFKKKEIFISPFLERFYFLKMNYKITRDECYIVEKVLDLIEEMNVKYVEKTSYRKKKRIEKRKKEEDFRKNSKLNHVVKIKKIKKNHVMKKNLVEISIGNTCNNDFLFDDHIINHNEAILNNISSHKKKDQKKKENSITPPDPNFMIFQKNHNISQKIEKKKNIETNNFENSIKLKNKDILQNLVNYRKLELNNFVDGSIREEKEDDCECECKKRKKNLISLQKKIFEKNGNSISFENKLNNDLNDKKISTVLFRNRNHEE